MFNAVELFVGIEVIAPNCVFLHFGLAVLCCCLFRKNEDIQWV